MDDDAFAPDDDDRVDVPPAPPSDHAASDFDVRLSWPSEEGGAWVQGPGGTTHSAFDDDDDDFDDDAPRNVPAVPLLPAIAGRVESVHGGLATLSMRIDSLVTAVNSFRALLTERLADYSETVARLARTQAVDLAEYRHSSDRLAADVRRVVGDTEETLRRLGARVDELGSDMDVLSEAVRAAGAESRDATVASDKLGRQLAEGLDLFGERVLGELGEMGDVAENAALTVQREVTKVRRELGEFRKVKTELSELAAAVAEVFALRTDLEPIAGIDLAVEAVRVEVANAADVINATRDDLGLLAEPVVVVAEALGTLQPELTSITDKVDALTARLDVLDLLPAVDDSLRAVSAAVDRPAARTDLAPEEIDAIAAAVAQRLGKVSITERQLDRLVDAVVERLEAAFEIVPEQEPAPAAPPPPPPPAAAPSRRARR